MQLTLAAIMIKTYPSKSSLMQPLIAGIAVLLFGSASVAHRLDWRPGPPRATGMAVSAAADAVLAQADSADGVPAYAQESRAESRTRVKRHCSECGVVESIQESGSGSAAGTALPRSGRYELTLRLNDGSRHVIANAPAGVWKVGERVIAIAPAPISIK